MQALILVDIQQDFLPGGALAVPEGDRIIPVVNELQADYALVIATQDWHPVNHMSFAVNHPGRKPFEVIEWKGCRKRSGLYIACKTVRGPSFRPYCRPIK